MPAWQVVLFVAGAFIVGHFVGQKEAPREPGMPSAAPAESQGLRGLQEITDPQEALWVANAHFDRQQHGIAAASYERAIELGLDNADVRTDLGVCYRRLGEPQRAVEQFKQAAAADPAHPESRYNLGVVLLHDLEDAEGAKAAWEEFLRVGPDDPRAEQVRENLAAIEEMAPP